MTGGAVSEGGAIHAAAQAFDAIAPAYHRVRPGYPPAALDHLVAGVGLGPGTRVLDLAAGTGRFTEALTRTGAPLIAVEPLDGMLTVLRRNLPDVETRAGTAEAIPAGDDSIDVITVAQAFHWFDAAAALDEIARVLRPGGALVLVWNRRDVDVPVWAEVTDLLEPHRAGTPSHRDTPWQAAVAGDARFGPLTTATFPNPLDGDRDLLTDRVASISFVAAMPPAQRAPLLDAVRAVPDRLGLPATFALPYRTEVHVTHLV